MTVQIFKLFLIFEIYIVPTPTTPSLYCLDFRQSFVLKNSSLNTRKKNAINNKGFDESNSPKQFPVCHNVTLSDLCLPLYFKSFRE